MQTFVPVFFLFYFADFACFLGKALEMPEDLW